MNSEPVDSGMALKAAYRAATLSCPLQGEGCPSADEIAATARGELDPAQRERMLAILGNCTRCASLVQMAADLEAPAISPPRPRPRPGAWPWLGAGAAAVLALVMVAPWRSPVPEPTRGVEVEIEPAPNAVLDDAPAQLRWQAIANVPCRVTLRSDAAEVLVQSASVIDGRYVLDDATRARLARGGFLWTVDCGANRLGPFGFSVAP
jgi:hypothetical protein